MDRVTITGPDVDDVQVVAADFAEVEARFGWLPGWNSPRMRPARDDIVAKWCRANTIPSPKLERMPT